jgi:hypothetical protein
MRRNSRRNLIAVFFNPIDGVLLLYKVQNNVQQLGMVFSKVIRIHLEFLISSRY